MGRLDKQVIRQEWDSLPKDWYSVYQWPRTCGVGYTEWIAEWIEESFADIQLATNGLRQRNFKIQNHQGQIKLQTEIEQLTEKRFVRAIFNLTRLPLLGDVIDYEIPLKETNDARQGDIDLLCVDSSSIFCVEAKQPRATESVLKAILQAFAYTLLVQIRKKQFVAEFCLPANPLTPTVLTFAGAASGRQLRQCDGYPRLCSLVRRLNARLAELHVAGIRFFVIANDESELADCLTTAAQANGDQKAIFLDGFQLIVSEVRVA